MRHLTGITLSDVKIVREREGEREREESGSTLKIVAAKWPNPSIPKLSAKERKPSISHCKCHE